jgi:branched-chain amino acid transport system permease protein
MIIPAIHPYMGGVLGPLSFCIAVLGGLGSEKGALVGGLIIGLIESVGGLFIEASLAPAMYFIILVSVLVIRPTGLFGKG